MYFQYINKRPCACREGIRENRRTVPLIVYAYVYVCTYTYICPLCGMKAHGGLEIQLLLFLIMPLDEGGQFHIPIILHPCRRSPVATQQEAEWAPQLVWTLWRRDKCFVKCWELNRDSWGVLPAAHSTNSAIPALPIWRVGNKQNFKWRIRFFSFTFETIKLHY